MQIRRNSPILAAPSAVPLPLRVQLTAAAKAAMWTHIAQQPLCETGGILLGSEGYADQPRVIRYAIGPGSQASTSPTGFQPDFRYTEAEIVCHMQQHGADALYLGEWRYHPYPCTVPTQTERQSLASALEEGEYPVDHPLLLTWDCNYLSEVSVHSSDILYDGLKMEVI